MKEPDWRRAYKCKNCEHFDFTAIEVCPKCGAEGSDPVVARFYPKWTGLSILYAWFFVENPFEGRWEEKEDGVPRRVDEVG